ncbi:uncharacterized protein BDR25DRAFT_331481 [Lindgomyces ingoldianus]|uniref:Uncharacterized protein n=1 Tax=Lindgomyces ingoldianus TaxID=673940 RepID=A0ACB6R8R6_9PLEO|nr:uncharacterized protein BDR25DRAFT_331481 [Lindgomyces ingoldianus]KAF2475678.1 hypothetical protein BDR25DRAFT_331481 [Lindgomyces ingoldianus]
MDGQLISILGEPVTDPEEEAFLLFSQDIPSQSLGFIDSKAPALNITVAGHDLTIHQSRGLLHSDRKQGTTGAVVWKVTPLFAEWVASQNFVFEAGYLAADSIALELGAGVAGIVALALAPKIKRYIATDQGYVLRLLKQNISENSATNSRNGNKIERSRHKRPHAANNLPSSNIETLELDWESDLRLALYSVLGREDSISDGGPNGVDLLIACDCIYNDTLIEPLNEACAQICHLRSSNPEARPTLCLIAQQLRSYEVFESWLKSFHQKFHVWRVPDQLLIAPLREHSGFVIHIGLLR